MRKHGYGVALYPPPEVGGFTATEDKIGDFGVFFIVRFWVNPPHVSRMPFIKENLREQIKVALDDAGIATPYPHMQLLMPSEAAPSVKTSP